MFLFARCYWHMPIIVLLLLHVLLLSLMATTCQAGEDNNNNKCPQLYPLMIPDAAVPKRRNRDKLVIAHRGASYHLPEHSLEAYQLALEMGADFVEPDLVATSDGHLIAMHTVDLNVTTNVAQIFPSREWQSPFVNRSGYWSFNFTLAEIKQLRLRQRLPRARSTTYDGMFQVPTLVEIQQLINTWNQERIPQLLLHVDDHPDDAASVSPNNTATTTIIQPHEHYQQSAGIYAELKASPWHEQDANISLVDLFLQTLTEKNQDHVFDPILECPPLFKFDEYKVPPLVIQSFEGSVLQEMSEKWQSTQFSTTTDTPTAAEKLQPPLPPMILLLNLEHCWSEPTWFEIGETWRKYIQGLGIHKGCFPKVGTDYELEQGKGVQRRAQEFNLVIHPYTERPEHEFLMEGFQDATDEIQYLFCEMGAQGTFTESVSTAVMAARVGCPTTDVEGGGDVSTEEPQVTAVTTAPSKNNSSNNNKLCWEDTSEANMYVGVASFVMGIFLTALISTWVNRGFTCTKRPPRQQQVPVEDSSHGDLEEVPDDELL
ncbi:Glycerophosphodiester phosphodiesterase [Seminavis robusta]|uniref:glycerophosphodiester phosphodiesterase n=1 Tax=Seminavis robusta TaxID=568900 RepID=A0A9N8HCU4_9STRA|nr:Glycerophosphodiester phosphodiesterase [Seminavis robusta]|eukprot:Sro317_g115710.1 Glycerophosphodiester phosphodiesterase (543) ;mRNA; f:15079-16707